MSQVIVYKNPTEANLCICVPTGEADIQTVLANNCPAGAVIVDVAALPQGSDAQFVDAWELNGSAVTINFATAQAIKLAQYNAASVVVAQKRQLNTLAGIANTPDDAAWQANLANDRASIASATTTAQLTTIANPI